MTPEQFDAHFDRFTGTVFRLETLQDYGDPGEAERVAAYHRGDPQPERSIRTSPWLARIAATTLAGKRWLRVRVVEEPLTEYTRYELAGYVESQAAGEEIRIVRRDAAPAVATLRRDFWLFDAGMTDEFALLMRYGPGGEYEGAGLVTNPDLLEEFAAERELALQWAIPLNEYLAQKGQRAA